MLDLDELKKFSGSDNLGTDTLELEFAASIARSSKFCNRTSSEFWMSFRGYGARSCTETVFVIPR